MSTIKSPQELTQRLQSILRQASTSTPTRARLAEEIKQVAEDLEEDPGQQKTGSQAQDRRITSRYLEEALMGAAERLRDLKDAL